MSHYDCVIVGGGAVGLSLALALGQRHYKTLLIEQKNSTAIQDDFNARTVALSFASHRIYAMLGVWEKLQDPVPIQQVLVTVQGQYGSSTLQAKDEALPALGYVVGLQELEQTLEQMIADLPEVDILRPATVRSRQATIDTWHISVSTSDTQEITCNLLIGADGVASQLRQEQQINCQQTDYEHFAVLTNIQIENGLSNIAHERFLPQGAIALLPWKNSMATCVWTVNKNEAINLIQLDEKLFLQTCQAQLGSRIGKLLACGKRHHFPLQMQLAMNQLSARFLLMGNAAHNLHPIAAQGLNLSLRDIWQIRSQTIKAKTHCDIGNIEFLEDYLQSRKRDQSRVIFATDKIARFMSGGQLPSWLRALGLTLFDSMSPIKRKFTAFGMGLG